MRMFLCPILRKNLRFLVFNTVTDSLQFWQPKSILYLSLTKVKPADYKPEKLTRRICKFSLKNVSPKNSKRLDKSSLTVIKTAGLPVNRREHLQ